MRLEFAVNIAKHILNVSLSRFFNLLTDIVAFESVLDVTALDQIADFDRGEGARGCEISNIGQQQLSCHLMDPSFVEGVSIDDASGSRRK